MALDPIPVKYSELKELERLKMAFTSKRTLEALREAFALFSNKLQVYAIFYLGYQISLNLSISNVMLNTGAIHILNQFNCTLCIWH